MPILTRTYARDGDGYGRHALVNPGGDNRQRDVLHIVPDTVRRGRGIHPTRVNAAYVGAHRDDYESDPDYWVRNAR